MITKYKIVEELAQNKTIETIIQNVVQSDDDTLNDLSQILYMDLLLKPDDKIIQLYKDEQLQFFITRMVLNSINSKTSRYYYMFARHNNICEEIQDER